MLLDAVEVFADVTCPFAYVELRQFVARRTELGVTGPRLEVRAWPLELVDDSPIDADEVAEHVEALREQVAPGLFKHFTSTTVPHTALPAFALAAEAYAHGDDLGEAVSLAVRSALFEDGLDISDSHVLTAIARAHGLGRPSARARDAYRADYDEGRDRAVRGSPHFFVGERDAFSPFLAIEEHDHDITITPTPHHLDDVFVEAPPHQPI
jgi:predicted DsbA family dithiol-disulfide isomerase